MNDGYRFIRAAHFLDSLTAINVATSAITLVGPLLPRSDMGARLSSRGSGAGWFLGQDAELVAFGIGECDPAAAIGATVVGLPRGPECEDPLGLLLASAIYRPQVQVHAVLHRLTIRDGNEKQQLAPAARHDEAFPVPWLVRIIRVLGEVQHLRPEDRLCVRIPGVDRRVRYAAQSWRQFQSPVWSRQTVYAAARTGLTVREPRPEDRLITRSGHTLMPLGASPSEVRRQPTGCVRLESGCGR